MEQIQNTKTSDQVRSTENINTVPSNKEQQSFNENSAKNSEESKQLNISKDQPSLKEKDNNTYQIYENLQKVNKQIVDKKKFIKEISIKLKKQLNYLIDNKEKEIIEKLQAIQNQNDELEMVIVSFSNKKDEKKINKQIEDAKNKLDNLTSQQYIQDQKVYLIEEINKIDNSSIVQTFDIFVNYSFLEDFKNQIKYDLDQKNDNNKTLTENLKELNQNYQIVESEIKNNKQKSIQGEKVHLLIQNFLKLITYEYYQNVHRQQIQDEFKILQQEIGDINMKIIQ
ncbi:hypothetical protein ABPG72_021922 [Tetrahymena utriculariae]